ncbi:YbgA family protein [Candidatus Gracilibacteria bacterium]|nr:YbgA family protein [Candidatus Gracilibacteria bacterium]
MEINFKNINDLIKFQSVNKYLFMAYSPEKQKTLGNIISKYDKTNFEIIKNEFLEIYFQIIKEEITKGKYINAISHMFGYFKNDLDNEEKEKLKFLIEKYNKNEIKINELFIYLKELSIKYNKDYIKKQSILEFK